MLLSSKTRLFLVGCLQLLLVCLPLLSQVGAIADIVAVLPDRSTAYPNGVHNGLLLTAHRLNITVEVRDVGNFDPETSYAVLSSLIESEEQPKLYCIWPIDFPSRELLKVLYQKHGVPIIQMNQLPGEDSMWEWDHLLGYAGPDDALRASNAGIMMIQAMKERQIQRPNVVALGYPETYGGYHLSIAAFEKAIQSSSVQLTQKLPLPWGTQPAYKAVLSLLDEMGESLHGIYAMDDSILMGAYQALQDHPSEAKVSLVGTVCNGARQLLETKEQYGTTVQAPYLEGDQAIRSAQEYLMTGKLSEPRIRFTPNPIVTADTWSDMFIEFQGESYTADDLCTWSLFYERVAGVDTVDAVDDVCQIVECNYIPTYLKITGYVLCSFNYFLAILSVILLFTYRKKSIIVLAQPFFLAVVCVGAVIDNTSILFMGFDTTDNLGWEFLDAACITFPWLLSIGHMMTTATLVAKIYRVKQLIDQAAGRRGLRKAQVSVSQLAYFILLFISIDAVIMLAWTLYDPLQWAIKATDTDQQGYISGAFGQCTTSEQYSFLFPSAIALIHLAALIYANVLAYQTSAYHQISDSKNIAIALFNSIQLLVIVTPLLVVVEGNVATSYLIRVCFVFLNNFGVLALVVLPKLWKCVQGMGDQTPDIRKITASVVSQGPKRSNDDSANAKTKRRDKSRAVTKSRKDSRISQKSRSDTSGNRKSSGIEQPSNHTKPTKKSTNFSLDMTSWGGGGGLSQASQIDDDPSGRPEENWKDEPGAIRRPVDVLKDKTSWGGAGLTMVLNDDDSESESGDITPLTMTEESPAILEEEEDEEEQQSPKPSKKKLPPPSLPVVEDRERFNYASSRINRSRNRYGK